MEKKKKPGKTDLKTSKCKVRNITVAAHVCFAGEHPHVPFLYEGQLPLGFQTSSYLRDLEQELGPCHKRN